MSRSTSSASRCALPALIGLLRVRREQLLVYCRLSLGARGERWTARGCRTLLRSAASTALPHARLLGIVWRAKPRRRAGVCSSLMQGGGHEQCGEVGLACCGCAGPEK